MTKTSTMNKTQKSIGDAALTHTNELCEILYSHHISIARLYAFASGIKKPRHKITKKFRSPQDNKRLLWSVQILKNQITEIEKRLSTLIISS